MIDAERVIEKAFNGCLFAAATLLAAVAGGHHWAVPVAMLLVSVWMLAASRKETTRLVCALALLFYAGLFAVAGDELEGARVWLGAVVGFVAALCMVPDDDLPPQTAACGNCHEAPRRQPGPLASWGTYEERVEKGMAFAGGD